MPSGLKAKNGPDKTVEAELFAPTRARRPRPSWSRWGTSRSGFARRRPVRAGARRTARAAGRAERLAARRDGLHAAAREPAQVPCSNPARAGDRRQ